MKIDTTFLINMLHDLLSIFIFLFLIMGFYTIANLIIGVMQRNDFGIFGFLMLWTFLFFSLIVTFGIFIISLSFFKSKIYSSNFRDLLKFHIKWFPLWVLLYILLSFMVDIKYQGYYLIIGFLIYGVLTNSFRYKICFDNHHTKLRTIIWNNLLKYLLIGLTFIILSLIGLGIFSLLNLNLLSVIWLGSVYLFALNWGRIFLLTNRIK